MEMKKERIVVLCLCIMLSGALHTQWIAWAWQHALLSPTQAVGPVRAGSQSGTPTDMPHFSTPSNFATVLACAAWPPLSILYSEAIVVGKKLETPPRDERMAGQNQSMRVRYTGVGR
jgi:hypothetical protein